MMAYERVATNEDHELQTPWETLRKHARNLEQQIDSRLILLSQGIQEQSAGALSSTQQEITGLLSQLTTCTQDMQSHVDQNASLTHLHSRHLANLYEYNREFHKTRATIQQQQNHSELLSGGIYSRNGASYQNQQARMEQSHNAVDEILQRAMDSQADLERQQGDLRSYQNRLKRVLVQFPLVRNVINKIQRSRGKESMVLGLLIGFCSIILLYMMFGR